MIVAVVGHTEWVDFASVEHVPRPGEIVHARDSWAVPGGGGAVAAVQLARLAGAAHFFTALGDDDLGQRSVAELEAFGVQVHAAFRPISQRRAFTHVDSDGERTITVLGRRLGPHGDDALPWDLLHGADAVYFTAGDVAALTTARTADRLVATSRSMETLSEGRVELDALVGSAGDPSERFDPTDLDPRPRVSVWTDGARGGWYEERGESRVPFAASEPPAVLGDAYGCGDSFAAALAFGLGRGDSASDAIALAARCGAAVLGGRGPYEAQLGAADL